MNLAEDLTSKYDVFLGIDVDKKSFSFTTNEKNLIKSKKIPADPDQLYNYTQNKYPDKKILFCYEAGPTGFHLYDFLTSKNQDCFVISPSAIPTPKNERVKNNKIDSVKLASYLKSGHLTSIRVPTGSYRELRHLVRIRENHTADRKRAKQRIKGLLLLEDLYSHIEEVENAWNSRYIQALKTIPCSDAVRIRLDMLIVDLEYAKKQLLTIHRQIKKFVTEHADIQKNVIFLESIPGIGFIIATTILGKIGNPSNLKSLREIACFLGLTPSEHSTGETISRGNITHLGDGKLRSLLIEAAWMAIRRDNELNQFFSRIKNRNHPKGASQKAITAVARKLTQRIYAVLKEQRNYVIH